MNENQLLTQAANRVFGRENRPYVMGIAMIWIVLFHISFWYREGGLGEPAAWISIFAEGQLGVDIFLFLSAYGLEASVEKNSLGRFYQNRARRLLPACVLFLITLFATFERHCPPLRMLQQCLYQLTGLSLFQYPDFFSPGFCFDWFSPAIIFVYIFFPLISRVIRYAERKGVLAEMVLILLAVVAGHWIHCNKHFPFNLLAYRMPVIVLGVLTYRHLQSGQWQRVLSLYLVTVVLAFLCTERAVILSSTVPPLLAVFALTRFQLPCKKFVCLVGRHSYEVYLAHIFAVAFFIPMGIVTSEALLLLITIGSTAVLAAVYSLAQKLFA